MKYGVIVVIAAVSGPMLASVSGFDALAARKRETASEKRRPGNYSPEMEPLRRRLVGLGQLQLGHPNEAWVKKFFVNVAGRRHPEFRGLRKRLTNFLNCEGVLAEAFKFRSDNGLPFQTLLELGVYQPQKGQKPEYPTGQSTRSFFILHQYFPLKKMVSLDIADCRQTISESRQWCLERGVEPPEHEFVQCSSIEYHARRNFAGGLIDFIFLDTNHDDSKYPARIGHAGAGGAGMTYKEICHLVPQLSEHGVLFIHDTNVNFVPRRVGWNTMGAVLEFLDKNPGYTFVEHNPNECGLGQLMREETYWWPKDIPPHLR